MANWTLVTRQARQERELQKLRARTTLRTIRDSDHYFNSRSSCTFPRENATSKLACQDAWRINQPDSPGTFWSSTACRRADVGMRKCEIHLLSTCGTHGEKWRAEEGSGCCGDDGNVTRRGSREKTRSRWGGNSQADGGFSAELAGAL